MSNDDRAEVIANLRIAEAALTAEVERLTAERETTVRDLRSIVAALRALDETPGNSDAPPVPIATYPRMTAPNGNTATDLVVAVLDALGEATLTEIAAAPMLSGVQAQFGSVGASKFAQARPGSPRRAIE